MASLAQEDVFEAHQGRGWRWFLLIFFILVVGNGTYELFFEPGRDWSDGIFLFLITPLLLDQVIQAFGPPILRLDRTGLTYRSLSRQAVPWERISLVEMIQTWGSEGISINLKDGVRLPPTRWFGLQRLLHRIAGRGDFTLYPDMLDRNYDESVDAIERIGGITVTRAP